VGLRTALMSFRKFRDGCEGHCCRVGAEMRLRLCEMHQASS
jgi:hypothetical protein